MRSDSSIAFFSYQNFINTICICMVYVYVMMMVYNFFLSKTPRSTLDYILIDRSDRDLSNDDKISREINGSVGLAIDTTRIVSCNVL